MGNSSSQPKVSAQDKAILDLKIQRDKLHQHQRRLTPLVAQYHEVAVYHLRANDKPRALLALRRKKYQESILSKTDAQLAQLEALTSDVEFALVQKDVLFGLQRGTEVLKEIRKEMGGIEGVEKLMARNEEERQFTEEVAETLSGQMTREEEDEIEDELAELERGEAKKEGKRIDLPDVGLADPLPQAPKKVPTTRQREENVEEDKPQRVLA